jgi:hypothetical protein
MDTFFTTRIKHGTVGERTKCLNLSLLSLSLLSSSALFSAIIIIYNKCEVENYKDYIRTMFLQKKGLVIWSQTTVALNLHSRMTYGHKPYWGADTQTNGLMGISRKFA